MNLFLTIIIAGMVGTGAPPAAPGDGEAALQNIPPQALLYSVEAKENAQDLVEPEIWDQILSGMAGSGNAEFIEVYLVNGNDLGTAKKLTRLNINDHSYSMNVPPASQILYIAKRIKDGAPVYSMNGVVNKQNAWEYISTVIRDGNIHLLKQDKNKAFTALQSK